MALKSSYSAEEKGAEIEEALDALDKLVDRVKVLYEQYFMGIQKQAPSHLHTEVERRLREVTQLQIRNTALRYRFATVQQKFGAYNAYWRRSLREIEAGRYVRNLAKLRRQAMASGENIPPEILASMPKRMRDAVDRDRAQALAEAQRRGQLPPEAPPSVRQAVPIERDAVPIDQDEVEPDTEPTVARIVAPPPPPRARRPARFTTDPFARAGEQDIADALSGLADEALAAIDRPTTAPPPVRSTPETLAGVPRPFAPPPPPARRSSSGTRPPPVVIRPPANAVSKTPTPPSTPRLTNSGSRPPASRTPTPPSNPRPTHSGTRPPGARSHSGTRPPPHATKPTTPPAVKPASAAPRPAVPGMTEAETRALYQKYVKAREVVGDRSEGFTYEKLLRTLSNQAPKILHEHKATVVEFNVVIRDNKVVLKAKPR